MWRHITDTEGEGAATGSRGLVVAWQPVATDGDAKRAREYLLQGERRLGVGSLVHADDHKVIASG